MRPRDKDDMLRMLRHDDCMYGFKSLSSSDFDSVVKIYRDAGFLRGVEQRDEIEKILLDTTYRGDKRDTYGNDLIKARVLDLPKLLQGKTVKEIKELMERKSISNFRFSTSYFGTYTKAIKVLQQVLNISVTGKYTEDVAVKVYEKIKRDLKNGQGYLASEDDPDRIFKYDFKEYVVCVDNYIWKLCGLEEKFLVDDNATIWNHEDVDKICKELLMAHKGRDVLLSGTKKEVSSLIDELSDLYDKRLEESLAFKNAENSGNSEATGCIYEIRKAAETKARELLDKVLKEEILEKSYEDVLYKNIYDMMYKNEYEYIKKKENAKFLMEILLKAIEVGLAFKTTGALNPQNIQMLQTGGAAAMPAYLEIAETGLKVLIDDQPGLVDVYRALQKDPDTQRLAEIIWEREFVEDSQLNYMVKNTVLGHRKRFIERISDLIHDTTFVKFPYNDSMWETSYYNYLIGDYLKKVKLINEEKQVFKNFIYDLN